ncbi:type II toxin-antitoxin system Phd/YefM family antitoxin [Desulforamulus hydrothermalis]|uniref:Antitoxin n=1 Tax=Desulforamulus hydrothermalis Lam5 = DSM 18033 TaxID=1121428 RepID=K8DZR0_9FIRM|nr:type II toxin-antitoxin system Phd/YefM family antitoxin [Desulforamulus hydrothermalis]CCO08525.1 Prevent-host-death family protein [Desulforamulus hydrothermalis Lam5 = DSM 18033]SHH50260.1 antitoxin Phd [Desulforamulus hydrothermalis Lam5 = DSM 18033]
MNINTDCIVSISDANQNFSRIARLVDEKKKVIVMKNNKPRYLIIDFDDYEAQRAEEMKLDKIADNILEKNLNAFKRLAE